MEKNVFVFIQQKNRIYSVKRDEVPEVWFFILTIIGWGESGKTVLNETLMPTM